jgi:hypothetical protein
VLGLCPGVSIWRNLGLVRGDLVGLLGYFFVDCGLVSRKVTILCWVFAEVCRFGGIWG